MGRRLLLLVAAGVACTLATVAPTAGAAKHRPYQHVTIFSDSVGAALDWDSRAKHVVERGNRILFELHPCGRLVQPGCLAADPPPSVLNVVHQIGRRIGPNVVVFIGYNDNPATYRNAIPGVLRAMQRHGAKHVIWLTLQPVYKQYVDINNAILSAGRHHHGLMTVLAWGAYSRGHSSWFGPDGIHMTGSGAVAFAAYLHRSLKRMHLTGPLPRKHHPKRHSS